MLAEVSASAYAKLLGTGGSAGAGDGTSSLQRRWFALFLVLCWIQFTGAWLYPPTTFGTVDTDMGKAFGVPFQYLMWLLILLSSAACIRERGLDVPLRPLMPFLPFLVAGAVSAVLGYSPLESMRRLVFWLLMGAASVSIGQMLDARSMELHLRRAMSWILGLSLVVVFVLPEMGTHRPGGEWRGLFVTKNGLGWMALLTLAFSLGLPSGRSTWVLGGLAWVVLVGSASKGALSVGLLMLVYLAAMRVVRRRLSVGLGTIVLMIGAVAVGLAAMFALPFLLSLLGRDPTLTGRTDIWRVYLEAMLASPLIGQGPGAFTGTSPLTLPLAYRLSAFGSILTPHNMLLGAFGDAGAVGLAALALPMLWLTVWLPLSQPSRWTTGCAAVGFAMLGHGMVETHEVYAAGPGMFLLLLLYTVHRERWNSRVEAPVMDLRPVAERPTWRPL